MTDALLAVDGIDTFYGHSQALFGVSLVVHPGEVVTLLGRNGMGKTTTIRSIMGLTLPARGSVSFDGAAIRGWPAYRIARCGIGLVPEGRRIFPNLSVKENLTVVGANRGAMPRPWTLQRVFDYFPSLAERCRNMGGQLSGGEQQMLAIGRALMTNPKLLLLDEATEGLSPLIREEIWRCIARLKDDGQAILLIDKNLDSVLAIADRHYVLEKGRVVWRGTSCELAADEKMQHRYLGI